MSVWSETEVQMGDPTATRRRLLEGAGVGGSALLAGCADQLGLGGSDATEQTDSGGAAGDGVGAIAAVDQEALRQEQSELREALRAGNITRAEAQEQAAELREEYVSDAVTALSEMAEATDGISVGEEFPSLGAVILTGEAGPIVGILDSEATRALVSRSDVEDQARTPEPTGTTEAA